jgi:AraC family transcriptional regulator
MDYLVSFSHSIDFIEANLKTPITVTTIATRVTNYSLYHYVRLFRLLTGETPGSYLRKRRLTEAARDLLDSDKTIIDIAVDYQFQSHEAFSRSFKNHFGITPSELRRQRQFVHLTPRAVLAPIPTNKTVTEAPQISHCAALLLTGIAYHGDNSHGELVGIWQSFLQQIENIPNQKVPRQTYGLWCYPNNFQVSRDFDYLAAVAVEKRACLPPTLSSTRLKHSRYASFEHHGPIQTIRQTYLHIYGEWLPQSGYRLAGSYDLESYDERFTGADQADSILNILVPIRH